jgi:hypothetical protein
MAVTYENHQIVIHVPVDLYRRIKTVQTERLLEALHSHKDSKRVSLHDIVIETLAEKFPEIEA